MPYLVDSDWVIDHLDRIPEATNLLSRFAEQGLYISIVTYMEVYQGTLRADVSSRALDDLRDFVSFAPILPFSLVEAERTARLRQYMTEQGKRPDRRAYDLLIAATALEHNLTLLTRNVRDYADIPGLKLFEPV